MSEPIAPEHAEAAKGLAGKLQHKVGPFPLWLWIGIGGGVILLVLRRGAGTGGAAGATPDPSAGQDPVSGAPIDVPGVGGGGGDGSTPGGNTGGFEDPVPAGSDPGSIFDPGPFVDPTPPASDPVFVPHGTLGSGHNPDEPKSIGSIAAALHPAGSFSLHPPAASLPQGPSVLASLEGSNPNPYTTQPFSAKPNKIGFGLAPRLVVHSGESPAGRIAAATTPHSTAPSGSIVIHASGFGAGSAWHPPAGNLVHFN